MKPAEKEKWDSLSYLYMTEESDDCMDSEAIIVHKLPWWSRSKHILSISTRLKHPCMELNDIPFIQLLTHTLGS